MRFIALDYGKKRIGVAYADSTNDVVLPLGIISNLNIRTVISDLSNFIHERAIERIIIGLPLSFKFEETEICSEIRDFGTNLEETTGVGVVFVNEVMSTDLSKKMTGNSGKDDSVAAQIILSDYLLKYHRDLAK